MPPELRIGRAGDLLGRRVHDAAGKPLGRVADLITEEGTNRVVAAYVVKHRWGRLLGYERAEVRGPWIVEQLARLIWRRDATEVAWPDLRLAGD